MVTLFQLPFTLRLTTLFHTSYCLPHTSYCLPPVSVACYIPLLPRPTSCIYRGLSAIQNKQSSHTAYPVQQLWAQANYYIIFDLKLQLHHNCNYIIIVITSLLKPH